MKTRSDAPFFTAAQKKFVSDDLKEKELSEFQIEQFLITCERTLLDPFSRQIYARPQPVLKKFRGGPERGGSEEWVKELIIITAIDGLRAVAERSGEYRGQTPVEWYGQDPDTAKLGWLPFWSGVSPQFPEAARVGVHRESFKEPLVGVARYHSYVQMTKGYRAEGSKPAKSPQPTSFWLKMPDVMLAKCAEAIALRKAFPLLLSGIFLEEEIKDEADVAEEQRQREEEPTAPQERMIYLPTAVGAPAVAPQGVVEPPEEDAEPEHPAAPEKPARTRKAKPATVPEPEQPQAPTPAPAPAAPQKPAATGGADWESYVISFITMGDYHGRQVGELAPEQIKKLKLGWVERYAAKIAMDEGKQHEADMISAAYAHHFPG